MDAIRAAFRSLRASWAPWAMVACALILLGVVIVAGNISAAIYPASTPVGTVQAYLVDLQHGRLKSAYDRTTRSLDFRMFRQMHAYRSHTPYTITLTGSTVRPKSATVTVELSTFSAGPYGGQTWSSRTSFTLVRVDGRWLICRPLYYGFW